MKKIAVVGTGISGLTCAYLLSREHQATVFERNDYIGGHTATVDVGVNGAGNGQSYAIDTGFIVFNDRTYPNFEKLMATLGVESMPTQMSFSVQNTHSGLEYNGHTLTTLFAQRRNLLNPRFWCFLWEILRFNAHCKKIHTAGNYPVGNLGQFLGQAGYSEFFAMHYIMPMGAAIWSASINDMRAFSLQFFIRFFHNHGLLNITDRPRWYVLKGGSRSYIPGLTAPFADNIRLSTPVKAIRREQQSIVVTTDKQGEERFDDIVLACHSDQALAMLEDASPAEQDILADMSYQDNEVVLHTDTGLLPKRPAAWASWNYRMDSDCNRPASITYNMNILQRLPADAPVFCVTLNQSELIDPNKILRRFSYAHPVFNEKSMAAAQRKQEICGRNRTYFAGAYWYSGFHEDGVRSALDVCEKFGARL